MVEQNEISFHEIEVARVMREQPGVWMGNKDIAAKVRNVSYRTVRAKTAKFVELGLCDVAEVFPSHRYRWSELAKQRNAAYLLRLDRAEEALRDYMASMPQ